MLFYTIRHPQTEWHIQKRLQGHKDSKLTEFGIKTAMKLGKYLKNENITKIFSSDLGRCSQTAKIVANILDVPIECSNELRERNFGKLNGEKNVEITDYDLSPKGIYNFLQLDKVKWSETSQWGHFGRNFPWK